MSLLRKLNGSVLWVAQTELYLMFLRKSVLQKLLVKNCGIASDETALFKLCFRTGSHAVVGLSSAAVFSLI